MRAVIYTIVIAVCLAVGAVGILGYRAKRGYEKARTAFNAHTIKLSPMTSTERSRMTDVMTSWQLYRITAPPCEHDAALKSIGYPDTVEGLIKFWSDLMPPFSFTNFDQDKYWIARAEMRDFLDPTAKTWYRDEGILFLDLENKAVIMTDTPNGIQQNLYLLGTK